MYLHCRPPLWKHLFQKVKIRIMQQINNSWCNNVTNYHLYIIILYNICENFVIYYLNNLLLVLRFIKIHINYQYQYLIIKSEIKYFLLTLL